MPQFIACLTATILLVMSSLQLLLPKPHLGLIMLFVLAVLIYFVLLIQYVRRVLESAIVIGGGDSADREIQQTNLEPTSP